MNRTFARRLIEQPDEHTTKELFAGPIEGVFWVDWREADDDIIRMAGDCLGSGAMAPEWIDGKLHIRYRETLTPVPLAFKPGEQDITLLTLNSLLAPEFEIRCIKASDGGDTLAFMVLDGPAWAALETIFGARVDQAFARITTESPFFAHAETPPAPVFSSATPPADVATLRRTEASDRLKEGLRHTKLKQHGEAIAIFDEIDRRYGQDSDAGMHLYVVSALVGKGDDLYALKKHAEAIAAYEAAYLRFGKSQSHLVRELVAAGLFQQGPCWEALGKPEEKIAAIDRLCARFSEDSSRDIHQTLVSALRNKAIALGKLNRIDEQIATYEETVRRFGENDAPAIRAEVGLALNGAGYCRMMQAKQAWADAGARTALLRQATTELRGALERCEERWKVMVLGNLGYALFLSGDELGAVRETQECLRLGGIDALQGQRSDAAAHRIAERDADYEDMLKRIWGKLQSGGA